MIVSARRFTPGAAFYVGRGESLTLPDHSVDVAFSTISFHHWKDQAAGLRVTTQRRLVFGAVLATVGEKP